MVAAGGSAAKQFENKHHVVGHTVKGVAQGVGWVVTTLQQSS
jgi:hypothetical protein